MSRPVYEETPEFLGVFSVLRSKKKTAHFMKGMRGLPFGELIKAAKGLKKDADEKKALRRLQTFNLEDRSQQSELLFILRTMALVGLPHRSTELHQIRRSHRTSASSWVDVTLTIREYDKGYRIPFGLNARRIFILLCTLAVKSGSPRIDLSSVSEFMRKLGWKPSAKGQMGGALFERLAETLESFQKLSFDFDYHGVFRPGQKGAETFSIIRGFNMPTRQDAHAVESGSTPLGLESLGQDPGRFWVQLDPIFFRELCGDGEHRGSAFPFTQEYLRHFTKSTEIDMALMVAARVSAAQSRSMIPLHDIWQQSGINPDNYGNFKKAFINTLNIIKTQAWEGCNAEVVGHHLIVDKVEEGKELVPRQFIDQLMDDFLGLTTPEAKAAATLRMTGVSDEEAS